MEAFFLGVPVTMLVYAFVLSLGVSALGFLRVDWFVSLGYGFSIVALAVLFGVWNLGALDVLSAVQLLLLVAYGLRLSLFLIQRERSASFARELEASKERSRRVVGPLKLTIWVSVALLYVTMASPSALVLTAGGSVSVRVIGVALMIAGLLTEALADAQKSAAKRHNPKAFVKTGLYAVVRYPNYFGEMLFWLGHFVTGLTSYKSPAAWLIATVGLVCIQLVMLGSARRLELKQAERYGNNSDFQRYERDVPVLFPLLPIKSLKKLKVYLG